MVNNPSNNYYSTEKAFYDAAGMLERSDLGVYFIGQTPVLRNDPTYYLWNTSNMGGRLSSNVTQRIAGGTQTRQSLSYQYNTSGNISSITNNVAPVETQTFIYDTINRLTDVTGAVAEHYEYDVYGRLSSKTGQGSYTYTANRPGTGCQTGSQANIFHAVSAVPGKSFSYDCNGNMTGRTISGTTYTLGYDAENRMVKASWGSNTNDYKYDGNGVRVKSVVGGVTTVFIGGYYEWNSNGLETKYYGLGGSVSAMRRQDFGGTSTLYWVLGDHLGSVSIILDENGNSLNPLQNVKYLPWGGLRTGSVQLTLTMKGYTGQYREDTLGLMFFNARWVDAALGRFIQADSIIPNGGWPPSFDRYAYVLGNPVNLVDPSGNNPNCGPDGVYCDNDEWNDYDYDPDLSEKGKMIIEIALELQRLSGKRVTLSMVVRLIFEREYDGWGSKTGNELPGIPDVFTEASARGYWKWAKDQYDKHTNVTLINWLVAHNSVAQSLYTDIFVNLPAGTLPGGFGEIFGNNRNYSWNSKVAGKVASALIHTPEEWKVFDPNRPYSFAFCNDSLCKIAEKKQDEFDKLYDTTFNKENNEYDFSVDVANVYFKSGESYIATFNQIQYWSRP